MSDAIFAQLVADQQEELYRLAAYYFSHHDAEEIVNWTFFMRLKVKGPVNNEPALLWTICYHLCVDADRSRRARRQHECAFPAADNGVPLTADDFGGDAVSPADKVALAEELGRVRAAVEKLPRELQSLLRERFQDDRTLREIGEPRGLGSGAVDHRLHQGLSELREKLGDE